MSEEKALVFGALTLDTNILEDKQYWFDGGLLKQLTQFANSPIRIVFSDVVHNEAKKHLASKITTANREIKKAIRSATNRLKLPQEQIESAKSALNINDSDEELAEKQLQQYYEDVQAEIIESKEHLDKKTLMQMYFATTPPFELKKDKKNEFPDAIALISLENWADDNSIKILVISKDKGWVNFAEKSEWLTVISDLGEAIQMVHPEQQVKTILKAFNSKGLFEEGSPLYDSIEEEIKNNVEGASVDDISVEASSQYCYEYEDLEANYISHDFHTDEAGQIKVAVLSIESEKITLMVRADIKCEVGANFDFSVWDSVDKEYIGLSIGEYFSVEEEFHTEILIEIYGDFSQGYTDMDIGDIIISENIGIADFGDIEPDWRDYDEE